MSQSLSKDVHVVSFHDQLRLALNPITDGSNGYLRAPHYLNQLQICNDAEAILKFLEIHSKNNTTFRVYQKELTRLQMWSVLKLAMPLSSLNIDHYRQYIKFMTDPDDGWIGPRARIDSVEWRPFTAKRIYSDNSKIKSAFAGILTSISCIQSFLNWLNKIGYLISNPIYLLRLEFISNPPSSVRDADKTKHYFDDVSFLELQTTLDSMPRETKVQIHKYQVSKILVALVYHLDTSLPEISKATMSNFVPIENKWFWVMNNSRGVEEKKLLSEEMLEELSEWQQYLDYSTLVIDKNNIPLIPPVTTTGRPLYSRGGLGDRRLAKLIQGLLTETARQIALTNPAKAKRITHASSRWLVNTKLKKQNTLFKS